MKSHVLILLIFLLIISIEGKSQQRKSTQGYSSNSFIKVDSLGSCLIPVHWGRDGKINEIKIEPSHIFENRNFVFYDVLKDNCTYVFKDSIQLVTIHHEYDYSSNSSYVKYLYNNFLLFEVINVDYNGDDKINKEDPKSLYILDLNSMNPKQVTPKEYSLKSFEYIKETEIILAILIYDVNDDKSFDINDSEVIYKIDLNNLEKSEILLDLKIKSE